MSLSPSISPSSSPPSQLWSLGQSDEESDGETYLGSDENNLLEEEIQATVVPRNDPAPVEVVLDDPFLEEKENRAETPPNSPVRFPFLKRRLPTTWTTFLEYFALRDSLETSTLWLMQQLCSSTKKPYTLDAWKAAHQDVPFQFPEAALYSIGIYRLILFYAHQYGLYYSGSMCVPALGRLAILLPPFARGPASLTLPAENYRSWTKNRKLSDPLLNVYRASLVIGSYGLALNADYLFQRPAEQLAEPSVVAMDLIAWFVALVFRTSPDPSKDVRTNRLWWNRQILNYLIRHNVIAPLSEERQRSFCPLALFLQEPHRFYDALSLLFRQDQRKCLLTERGSIAAPLAFGFI